MFANAAKSFIRKSAPFGIRANTQSVATIPARAFSVELDGFGAHKFMGDIADEFLKPEGLSWADLEDGEWTKDMAKADKVM